MAHTKKMGLEKQKIIFAEGTDAYYFLIHALGQLKITDVQVLNFGGITELTTYMEIVSKIDGYGDIQKIVIARDAETDPNAAVQSIESSLKTRKLTVPAIPFEFTQEKPNIAYMIFPGYTNSTDKKLRSGTLEDLCWDTIAELFHPVRTEAETYINTINANHGQLSHPHKSKLHVYLASQNKYVGLKLGEATKAGAWDLNTEYFKPFKHLLISM